MTDREERQHVIEVLKQMRLDYEDFWEENDTEEIKAFNYAIASIETDLKYDLLYEETSGQADKPTTKNNLGVASGLEKNSKKLEKDFGELDCISRADAIKALEQEPKSEWEHDHEILRAYADGANNVLDKLRAEIEQDLEQDKIARSVFRYEEINAVKAEQCTGSITAYHNVIAFIDKYKSESEERKNE